MSTYSPYPLLPRLAEFETQEIGKDIMFTEDLRAKEGKYGSQIN